VLVPLWVFALRYDQKKVPIRLIINGQTGRAFGKIPWSWPRLIIAIVLGVLLVTALAFYLAHEMRLL
jgi:hypothetical protein